MKRFFVQSGAGDRDGWAASPETMRRFPFDPSAGLLHSRTLRLSTLQRIHTESVKLWTFYGTLEISSHETRMQITRRSDPKATSPLVAGGNADVRRASRFDENRSGVTTPAACLRFALPSHFYHKEQLFESGDLLVRFRGPAVKVLSSPQQIDWTWCLLHLRSHAEARSHGDITFCTFSSPIASEPSIMSFCPRVSLSVCSFCKEERVFVFSLCRVRVKCPGNA